jgi:hypothetical protein
LKISKLADMARVQGSEGEMNNGFGSAGASLVDTYEAASTGYPGECDFNYRPSEQDIQLRFAGAKMLHVCQIAPIALGFHRDLVHTAPRPKRAAQDKETRQMESFVRSGTAIAEVGVLIRL